MKVYRSRRIQLPDFMWHTLAVLTEYVNETTIRDPDKYVDVSGLLQAIVFTSVRVELLQMLAEASPEFQEAIAAWVDAQIEQEPQTATVFLLPVWSFARRAN